MTFITYRRWARMLQLELGLVPVQLYGFLNQAELREVLKWQIK
jgi:hypothetical protein